MLNNLEKKLDYKFKNRIYLKEALTHPSFQKKSLKEKKANNQRLEFLGDSVLNLVVTEYLYRSTLSWEKGKIQPEGEKNYLFLQIVLRLC